MKILAVFNTPGMTPAQYDQCISELEKAGLGRPDGRLSHVCGIDQNRCFVTDVWESEAKFTAFGDTLMPILGRIGVQVSEPMVIPYYNEIEG